MNKPIRIPTILGELVAYPSLCSDYPAIDIFLCRDGVDILIATVEVEHNFDTPSLHYLVYGDPVSDAPTITDRIFPEELDAGFASITDS